MTREEILELLDDEDAMRFTVVNELADCNVSPQLLPVSGGVTVAAHDKEEMFQAAYCIVRKLKDAYEWQKWGLGAIMTSPPLSIIDVFFEPVIKRPSGGSE